jgi:hypothetical protein
MKGGEVEEWKDEEVGGWTDGVEKGSRGGGVERR